MSRTFRSDDVKPQRMIVSLTEAAARAWLSTYVVSLGVALALGGVPALQQLVVGLNQPAGHFLRLLVRTRLLTATDSNHCPAVCSVINKQIFFFLILLLIIVLFFQQSFTFVPMALGIFYYILSFLVTDS